MIKKIFFATHNNENDTDGVWKKIKSQVSALRSMGACVDFFYLKNDKAILDDGINESEIGLSKSKKYFFYIALARYIKSRGNKYDIAYIRKPHGGLFITFLPGLLYQLKNDGAYIVIEVPTYPYKKELRSAKAKALNFLFDMSIPFFKRKVDEVLYMGEYTEKIWGVNATRISNGIDINDIKPVKEKGRSLSTFVIVCVANLEFWHGYDRIIEGVRKYNGNRNIRFDIVGYAQPEFNRLKGMVSKYGLDDCIIFHGRKAGEELDMILENADVCVDAVGRHRSGNNTNSSIKSKEYTARGLPFVKSHIDYSFDNEEFILQVAANDTPIDINELIKWRDDLPNGFSTKERIFASNNLTWAKQLEFLLERK
ncbi:glycosyltransferase family 4 protein [Brenneria izadpanahii]|uniref:Glycosyltransferase family 4 protein n=1 Tax=Brenneria izadpanahii TaxID=2722756 RepID=A0ABX7UXD5_9GAMM|nr:glycosyltransferase family 4 protein [Brenneria izadpanahii]QTF09272.1 glycosyltransferase family 4 protein [Brenneria izadpanahii]